MLKFKISSERFAEACNVLDYLAVSGGNRDAAIRVAPIFLLDESGEYIVKVILDADGDIFAYENKQEALLRMTALTPKRLEKLTHELMEAAKAIVNPPKDGG